MDHVAIIPADAYGKYETSDRTVFDHLHGSSWHQGGAKSFLFIEQHETLFKWLGIFAFLIAVVFLISYGNQKIR